MIITNEREREEKQQQQQQRRLDYDYDQDCDINKMNSQFDGSSTNTRAFGIFLILTHNIGHSLEPFESLRP